MVDLASPGGAAEPTKSGALVTRFLLTAQKQVGPSRVMFERIFIRGEPEALVVESLGLTHDDYRLMLRNLAVSTH